MLALPNPSSRFVRAAAAERADLSRHRERLEGERDRLLAELRRLDEALASADQRLSVLGQLIDGRACDGSDTHTQPATEMTEKPETVPDNEVGRHVLRGPAIRTAAVRVLISQPEHIEAIHYRRWYELMLAAGNSVAGKEPLAVFLTQVTRSPVVRKTTKPGMYEVDRQAPLRIRQRLERLHGELRELTVAAAPAIDLASVRARRHELDLAISQQEKALEEALRVLHRDDGDGAEIKASGAR
ncbi:MAG: hypothetical protein JOZ73_07345 [Solirubrobacterales bacterium]|nr:hypothetical protein [Solirubrobacterales bacterium]MBV9800655.1 hypothetical protein [Solirubrobacterales bacterium]